MQVKAIFFDLGGVIMNLNGVEEPIHRFQQLGVNDVDQLLGIYGQKGIFLDIEEGHITPDEFLAGISVMAGHDISYAEAQHAWLGFVHDVPQTNLEHLVALRNHYKLYLLSNTNAFIQDWARSNTFSADGHSILDFFDALYCSHELHDYKPSVSIFKKALQGSGLRPEECLFVDDSKHNADAAEQVGMHRLLVKSNQDWWEQLTGMLSMEGTEI